MTDRLAGVIVTFTHGIRDDDAEAIINAIRMVQGVLSVEPIPDNFDVHIATERAKTELRQKLWEALK